MTRTSVRLLAGIALLCTASTAQAQSEMESQDVRDDDDRVRVALGGSLGFTEGPDGVQLGFEIPISINRNLSVGPWLGLSLASKFIMLGATANVRYHFDVFESQKWSKLRPYVQGGVGLNYLDPNTDVNGVESTDFLMNMGLGLDYALNDHVSLASDLMFNLVPQRGAGDTFYWSWQFLGARYKF
jgi:opacity protein-like surface antigen